MPVGLCHLPFISAVCGAADKQFAQQSHKHNVLVPNCDGKKVSQSGQYVRSDLPSMFRPGSSAKQQISAI